MVHLETKTTEDYLAEFLSELFRAFNREAVDYAVARDYESLPRGLAGRDLDILVTDADFERAYRALRLVARKHGARVCKIDQEADTYAWAFVVRWEEPSWGIHIDFLRPRCNNWRGCHFLDETAAMERKVLINGIPTLRSDDIVSMQFCRDIVGNLYLREKYRGPVVRLYLSDPQGFEKDLTKIFGKRRALQLARLCAERNFADVAALGKKLRRALIVRNFLWSPARALRDTVLYAAWRYREYLRPNGVMVALIGGEPGRNQALTEGIRREIYRLIRSKIRVYEGRPRLLPSLTPLPLHRKGDSLGRMFHALQIAYDALDTILGYWLAVRRHLGRKCVAAVFDGYFYSHLSGSGGLPQAAAGFLRWFIPRPDVVVLLAGDGNAHGGPNRQIAWLTQAGVPIEKLSAGPIATGTAPPVQEIVRIIFESLWARLGNGTRVEDEPAPHAGELYGGKIAGHAGGNSDGL